MVEASRIGKRGAVVIPAKLRKRYGLTEGSFIIAEERDDGILIRPAELSAAEVYSPARIAEFHLNNAIDAEDYRRAVKEVRQMGLDPKTIPHTKPEGA